MSSENIEFFIKCEEIAQEVYPDKHVKIFLTPNPFIVIDEEEIDLIPILKGWLSERVLIPAEDQDHVLGNRIREAYELSKAQKDLRFCTWNSVKDHVLPRILHRDTLKDKNIDSICHKDFVNDCIIVFFIDYAQSLISVTTKNAEDWGVTIDEIATAAYENLDKLRETYEFITEIWAELGINPEHTLWLLNPSDAYESSQLLSAKFQAAVSSMLGANEFDIYIPGRSYLIVVPTSIGANLPRDIRELIDRVHTKDPYRITPAQFHVSPDGVSGRAPDGFA